MSMRMPKLTDFAQMCVELVPFPHPKDIVIKEARKMSKARQEKATEAAAAKKKRTASGKKAAQARAASFAKRDAERGKY